MKTNYPQMYCLTSYSNFISEDVAPPTFEVHGKNSRPK